MKTLITLTIALITSLSSFAQTYTNPDLNAFPIETLTLTNIHDSTYVLTATFYGFEGVKQSTTITLSDSTLQEETYFIYGDNDEIDHDFAFSITNNTLNIKDSKVTFVKSSDNTEEIYKVTKKHILRYGKIQHTTDYMTRWETKIINNIVSLEKVN